jgi:hypothetical protein
MESNQDFKDFGKEKLRQLKVMFEELEVQLSLGKAEAKEMFEREKKNMSTFINEQKAYFKREEKMAEEHWGQLREKFESLESQLSKDTPDGKETFDALKQSTLRSIFELENAILENYGELSTEMKEQLDQFKAILDSYRIQFALSEFGDSDESMKRRDELKAAVEEIRARMDKDEKDANKLDDFAKEMSNSFDHMKKAFSDLFS